MIKHYARKPIRGVYVNDSDYVTSKRIDGKNQVCPFFKRWENMIDRCSSPRYKSRLAYDGCIVSEEWHSFMQFKNWMNEQKWEGLYLDKDLLGNGKLYSKECCVFVTREVNNFIADRLPGVGSRLCGVRLHRSGKYQARVVLAQKYVSLGYFDDPEDACREWASGKYRAAHELASRQSNPIVSSGLIRFANKVIQRLVKP